jgi:hypothetical protein
MADKDLERWWDGMCMLKPNPHTSQSPTAESVHVDAPVGRYGVCWQMMAGVGWFGAELWYSSAIIACAMQ